MTKAERTRQFIVERTAPLFNSKGFDGTSLAALTASTGLTKGALYGNFNDKEDIALAAFQYSIGKVREMVKAELTGASTYMDQLTALLGFYSDYVFNPPIAGGCPLLNTAIEADDYRVSMRRVVVRELLQTVNFIADLIQRGVDSGEFRSDSHPKHLAYTIFCAIEGALMFSRVERSKEPMDIVVKHCKNILDQITS